MQKRLVVGRAEALQTAAIGFDLSGSMMDILVDEGQILSTTFTTVGGFIPILLFSEGTFWPPLAVVLAGGVGFLIILSLVFKTLVVSSLNRPAQSI